MRKEHFEKVQLAIAVLQRQALKVTEATVNGEEAKERQVEEAAEKAQAELDGAMKNMRLAHIRLKGSTDSGASTRAEARAATRKAEADVAAARPIHTTTFKQWRDQVRATAIARKEHQRAKSEEAQKRYLQEHWETLGNEQELDALLAELGVTDLRERREELRRQLEEVDNQLDGT